MPVTATGTVWAPAGPPTYELGLPDYWPRLPTYQLGLTDKQ